MAKITGTLERWVVDPTLSIIWGVMHGDTRGRFPDGTSVHTSHVEGLHDMDLNEGDIVVTMNSTYKLGTPAEG